LFGFIFIKFIELIYHLIYPKNVPASFYLFFQRNICAKMMFLMT